MSEYDRVTEPPDSGETVDMIMYHYHIWLFRSLLIVLFADLKLLQGFKKLHPTCDQTDLKSNTNYQSDAISSQMTQIPQKPPSIGPQYLLHDVQTSCFTKGV